MRLKFLFFWLLFLSSFILQGQQFMDLKKTANPVQKLQISHDLWEKYLRTDVDSLKILSLALQENHQGILIQELIFFSKRVLGCYWIRRGEIQLGKNQLKEALHFHRKIGDKANETEELNELGIASFMEGDYATAKGYFLQSLKTGKDSPDPTHFFMAELNLAKVYDKLNLKEKAKGIAKHYLKETLNRKKNESASNAYGFLSDLELDRKNLPLAKEYLEKSIHCLDKTDNVFFKAQALTNMGAYCATIQDFLLASKYFNQALDLRIKIKHSKGILESYYNLGSLAYIQNDYTEAENQFLKGLKYAEKAGMIPDQIDFMEMLVEVQKEVKNKDKEIEYYRQFIDLKDKNQELLLKNEEDNERLMDYFTVQKINEPTKQSMNEFWTGILVGSGSVLLCLMLIKYFYRHKQISFFFNRYDK
jgi:tetratricopeptide (TPR) repeat protein